MPKLKPYVSRKLHALRRKPIWSARFRAVCPPTLTAPKHNNLSLCARSKVWRKWRSIPCRADLFRKKPLPHYKCSIGRCKLASYKSNGENQDAATKCWTRVEQLEVPLSTAKETRPTTR